MGDGLLKKSGRSVTQSITVWVEEQTHAKYKALAGVNVKVPVYLRVVIDKELDRLIEIEGLRDPEFAAAVQLKDPYE